MELLTTNLKAILERKGGNLAHFLSEHNVSKASDLTLGNLELFCHQEGIELSNLLFYNLTFDKNKIKNLKLLILDIDGVMTDGGMYFSESGDQMKKYNTKDGMGILEIRKRGINLGIISSGFKSGMVKSRAELLKIEHLYVGREPKLKILNIWCKNLGIQLSEVGIIGDDINDLEVMRNVGLSVCPANAVLAVKSQADLVLQTKGGEGCIREFIDHYLLEQPLQG